MLYRLATEVGATKIALGHHLDDFIETLLLNLFFAGALKAMPARLVSDNGEHVVIRPLVTVTESEARNYAKDQQLPIIGCCCPACGDLGLQRQRVKRLIAQLEVEHPEIKNSMIRALANVAPRHLLDRRLNPLPELRALAFEGGAVPLPLAPRGAGPMDVKTLRACARSSSASRRAAVTVEGRVIGRIDHGLLVFVGVADDDGPADVDYIAGKLRELRIFPDEHGRMNRSVVETGGAVLVVSQFTLHAD